MKATIGCGARARGREIFLASRSKARRALLRRIGLSFRTAVPRSEERGAHPGGGAALVVSNARRKALDVARGLRSGIVIAADTVVTAGGAVAGKPRDLAEARATLKLLSRRPHWVHTGVAVADVARRRVYTAAERTKVFMRPLSDREINRYFRRVSPLGMAGGFDIQGLGGVFVERVEGCYFNVVGLPLAVLARLLRRAGVDMP